MFALMPPPPSPPYWPAYPEPEQSRLRDAYFAELDRYSRDIGWDFCFQVGALCIGMAVVAGVMIFN